MSWATLFKVVEPYIMYLETPEISGTAFLFAYNRAKTIAGFATAAHVVQHADDWRLPIKLTHYVTREEIFVTDDERVIFLDRKRDSASIILFKKLKFDIPKDTLPLISASRVLSIGTEVGWAGFPSIAGKKLCLFTGPISARLEAYDSYLIDGVAIHGVSGGPVFYLPERSTQKKTPKIIGTVTGYMPNRIGGEILPGLLRAQGVTAFHNTIKTIKSVDEARKKRKEQVKKEASKSAEAS